MHEDVHRGNDQAGSNENNEEGEDFEKDAFGVIVKYDNAGEIRKKYGKHFYNFNFKKIWSMQIERNKADQNILYRKEADNLRTRKNHKENVKDEF